MLAPVDGTDEARAGLRIHPAREVVAPYLQDGPAVHRDEHEDLALRELTDDVLPAVPHLVCRTPNASQRDTWHDRKQRVAVDAKGIDKGKCWARSGLGSEFGGC